MVRKVLSAYWLCLFFGTVLAVWMLAYATANFSKIEDKVMMHFEENWAELVASLPEEVLDKVPLVVPVRVALGWRLLSPKVLSLMCLCCH